MEEKKEQIPSDKRDFSTTAASFLSTSLAVYALMRLGNYRAALLFYPRSGGGGLNIYKEHQHGRLQRFFAIDFHPIMDRATKQHEWKLHYHRGENTSQMKKHRPYDGW